MVQQGVLTDVYCTIAELALAMGALDSREMLGCWEVDLDEGWFLAMNRHSYEVEARPVDGERAMVPGGMVAVWYEGVLVGYVDPWQGLVAVDGRHVHVQELIVAINGKIGRVQE
jgi:hypothetical protein